jgi:SAM-dependent methyltransferase
MQSSDVREYYEHNSRLFRRFGSARGAQSIHRAVWADGIRSQTEALNYAHALIAQHVTHSSACVVADLGCGFGGALAFLESRLSANDIELHGVTISAIQAKHARIATRTSHIYEGDFTALPFASRSLDFAFSIEAFVHAPSAAAYFAEVARVLRSGGKLILIDDTFAREPHTRDEQLWHSAYVRGWHVSSVLPIAEIVTYATHYGLQFTTSQDLTPDLRLRLLPRPLTRAILTAWRNSKNKVIASSVGSIALQHLLQVGVVRYRFMSFENG